MKKAKFAPVTAALLARKGETHSWNDGNAHAEAALETVDSLSRSLGRAAKNVANDKSAVPPFTIGASPTRLRNVTIRLSQSDYEHLNRLIAAKRDTTRQCDSPDSRPQLANGGTKTESAQIVSKWMWLKAVWSGFQAFGHGPKW